MDINMLKNYCLSMKDTYEDYPFGEDVLVVKVKSKMFALITEKGNCLNISLKCDPVLSHSLREAHASITAGYHLNKTHWNTIIIDGSLPEDEIQWMIKHSYEIVVKKLPKPQRDELLSQK
ncbi:MmcQ/YjbR family DNA-binding protein [Alkaliphilus peptidifermentans]|uniref:Predicted DNA-binding protein, MmcQ/YjbR family n=1 Tax=Alkaliphilus peptidifermentans DSM 18978 TaxID=1120976 RepID=A0A1G5KNI5_9FIRM|nr:MmcQ/YjbR family DNA-binding protein [Alkaliphilus peptidifermentans]SCZ02176.1 Predicted DNA-binding protein, MmcQ/YjbR family [Alkaliphilus peptidifermentans DSM 18978]